MAGSSKKSATKSEATPAVIKATKSLKKGKRETKDDSETKVNLKKPKKDVIASFEKKKKSETKAIMKGIADSLQRLEAKVDLLATKAEIEAILISAKGKKIPAMKPPTKAAYDSEDSYMDTSSEDEAYSDEEPAKKPAAKGSSSSLGGNLVRLNRYAVEVLGLFPAVVAIKAVVGTVEALMAQKETART
ncbi:unnamed protein product [Arabidopsis arenosa]|uniref:Uncharacterized protein n=1 Tax=Arabidopsis arenosa TaxID=38785 RepID=A0A8S1ZQ56_ARAAE|nr:unnamed protein product [Arabidopsis arenosa]